MKSILLAALFLAAFVVPSFAVGFFADGAAWGPSFRHSATAAAAGTPPDTEDPTDPTSLVATTVNSGRIDLTWTASTDNVDDPVDHYNIERCTGVGCSSFAQIDTSVTNSHDDTGLAASTSYTYRVIAGDAAGNTSLPSNEDTAVTDSSTYTGVCTSLADIAAMPEGTFCEIATNTTADVYPSPLPDNGSPNHGSLIMAAWGGGVMDNVHGRFLFTGGGHADYSGNEVYEFDFTTLLFSRIKDPSDDADIPDRGVGCGATTCYEYDDGYPTSIHSYNGLVYDPGTNSLIEYGGGPWGNAGGFTPRTYQLDLDDGSWTRLNDSFGGAAWAAGSIYYPPLDRSLLFRSNASPMKLHNVSADTYSNLTDVWEGVSNNFDCNPAWDSVNDVVVAVCDTHLYHIYVNAGTMEEVSPTGCTTAIAGRPGIAFDPVLGKFLLFYGNNDDTVYTYDAATESCATLTASGSNLFTPPAATYANRIYGRWFYVESLGVECGVQATTDHMFCYRPQGHPAETALTETALTTFTLTAGMTGTKEFKTAIELAEGAATVGEVSVDGADAQITTMNTWPDGSPRIVAIAGTAPLTADTPLIVTVYNTAPRSGTDLTTTDLTNAITAMGETSVQFGAYGTITLSDLTGSPDVWIAGPEMIEAVYRDKLTGPHHLSAEFDVQLYRTGKVRVRQIATNSYLDDGKATATANTETYVPTFKVDGSVVYNNGGSSIDHPGAVAYDVLSWVGSDPGVTVRHNMPDLIATKMIPPYITVTADEDALDNVNTYYLYPETYTPLDIGTFGAAMGGAGNASWIGLLKNEDALSIISNDDPRVQAGVFNAARAINSFPMNWLDASTLQPPAPTDYSTWTLGGAGGGGASNWSTDGTNTYDVPHHPSAAYLAYLLTADPYYWRTQLNSAASCWLSQTSLSGDDTDRLFTGQERGIAWCVRTLVQTVASAPDGDATAAEYKTLLASNINFWAGDQVSDDGGYQAVYGTGYSGMNTSGMFFTYSAGSGTAYGNGDISSFMFDFWVSAMGHAKDLHVLTGSDATSLDKMIAWMGKATVGMLGGDGDGYCFTEGDSYTVRISSTNDTDPRVWYDDWADIYTATAAAAGGGWPSVSSCGNTLLGSGSGIPDRSPPAFWDQKVAAAAYMARHGVTGASAAWSRLTGASNWADVQADCDVYPLFCLEP